jgi:Zn finger protein HypA/HybF involved in hydrogenase expression
MADSTVIPSQKIMVERLDPHKQCQGCGVYFPRVVFRRGCMCPPCKQLHHKKRKTRDTEEYPPALKLTRQNGYIKD